MCTASILNLCAISLDRYVAVTRPVTYPSIMSMGRAKILIAAVWVLSFLICFPPLVGWKDGEGQERLNCPWVCELTNDAGYVIYSALGSFYIPMFVMLFFYWRIYRAAVSTTRAINRGFRTTKSSRYGRFDEQRLTLRIHRGRGSVMQGSSGSSTANSNANSVPNSVANSPGKSPAGRSRRERIKISVSYPSNEAISAAATSPKGSAPASPPTPQLYAVHYSGEAYPSCQLQPRRSRPRLLGEGLAPAEHKDLTPSPTFDENKPKLISRMGKRNIKAQVKRFRMETKAAKTLGIIVGGFILCWLPFFTMYLIRAFCPTEDCIHPTVFSVLFWLGYCNSAINPCIYALFSKDFRFAFKRIICRCLCRAKSAGSVRRGSDGSQLGVARRSDPIRRSSNFNNNNDRMAERHSDSDPTNDPHSESR